MFPKLTGILSLCLVACSSVQPGLTDSQIERTAEADSLISRLEQLAANNRIAFGHQDDVVYGHTWSPGTASGARSDVKDVCGSLPLVIGFDLGHIEIGDSLNLDGVAFSDIRREAIHHFQEGGIITMSWHPRNPLTGGTAWDNSDSTVVGEALAKNMLDSWHKRIAEFFLSLKTPDGTLVPVIFRPWHEMTGSWFWWGKELCTAEEYIQLYRSTFNAMHHEGVNNLVFAYSTGIEPADNDEFLARYPGDDIVSVVGFDYYQLGAENGISQSKVKYMSEMLRMGKLVCDVAKKHGKIAAICETGLEGVVDNQWWTKTLLPVTANLPLAYVLVWRNAHDMPEHFYAPWPGHSSQSDFITFFNNPKTVFLND